MKEIIYYDEMCIPNQIRIVSEALCLDHTFSPAASQKIIGYKALLLLLGNPLIDFVYVNMDEGSAYIQNVDGKLESVVGWMKISDTNLVFQSIKDFSSF